ncbi:unnamed protein product [Schistocephalus solidus]|uniref:C2H2-type domain-containing protein n=1 Tax=Schistocephalus solidus TaxID=70667 RepID=A0A183TJ96_SCHSO|nr:unnamed protein product [Schistocephalus solidus]
MRPKKVTSAPDQHRRCPGPANMPALSTYLPFANRPDWTSSDAMHQLSDNSNFYVKFCQRSFRLYTLTPGINFITPTIIETTSTYSSPVTPAFALITTTSTTVNDRDFLLNCPQCDRLFTSRIGLVGHLRIHLTETGEPLGPLQDDHFGAEAGRCGLASYKHPRIPKQPPSSLFL